MKYGVYKNTDESPDVDPFTTIEGDLRYRDGAYAFYSNRHSVHPSAIYPMSAFYIVALED